MLNNPITDNTQDLEIEEVLIDFFTGEFLRRAKLFKKKMNEPIPDYFYYSVDGLNFNKPYTSKSNNVSDPTGDAVVRLIEVEEERKRLYTYYSDLQEKITSILNNLGVYDEDKIILYSYLGLSNEPLTTAVKFTSYGYIKAKIRIRKIIDQIEVELRDVVTSGCTL